jgi:hypothetical protein
VAEHDVRAELLLLEVLEVEVRARERGRQAVSGTEEIRIGEVDEEALRAAAVVDRDVRGIAAAEQVRLRERAGHDHTVLRRIAGAEAERAGRPLDHRHLQVELIRRVGRLDLEVDRLEVAEPLDALARDLHLALGIQLALGDRDLAPHHRIDRHRVAADLDPADEVERPLAHVERTSTCSVACRQVKSGVTCAK